jgi:hypothetical protein
MDEQEQRARGAGRGAERLRRQTSSHPSGADAALTPPDTWRAGDPTAPRPGAVMAFVTCPGCGEIAEVVDRFVLPSTDGPVEHVRTQCLHGHWFMAPVADAHGTD